MRKTTTRKPYTLAGAGPLTATVWRSARAQQGWSFQFNIIKTDSTTGEVTQQFCLGDIRTLAKLLQTLAVTLVDDEGLDREDRADLSELASRLRSALERGPSCLQLRLKDDDGM